MKQKITKKAIIKINKMILSKKINKMKKIMKRMKMKNKNTKTVKKSKINDKY